MLQHTTKELWDKGRDAEERLKKDSKHKVLFAAALHSAALYDSSQSLLAWQEANPDCKLPEDGSAPADSKLQLVALPVTSKLADRAMSEKDDCLADCLGVKLASFKRIEDSTTSKLKNVCQGFYATGPHDWKASLANDCSLDTLLKEATQSILKIKGGNIKEQLDSAEKELCVWLEDIQEDVHSTFRLYM